MLVAVLLVAALAAHGGAWYFISHHLGLSGALASALIAIAVLLPAASKRRNDRRELDVGHCGAECIELSRVQEHHAALAAGKELSFVPAAVLSHDADAVIALKCADPAAPYAARYGNGRGHGEIVVILLRRCPFSLPGEEVLYGGDEHQLDERSW